MLQQISIKTQKGEILFNIYTYKNKVIMKTINLNMNLNNTLNMVVNNTLCLIRPSEGLNLFKDIV